MLPEAVLLINFVQWRSRCRSFVNSQFVIWKRTLALCTELEQVLRPICVLNISRQLHNSYVKCIFIFHEALSSGSLSIKLSRMREGNGKEASSCEGEWLLSGKHHFLSGGVRAMTAIHYFVSFQTWRRVLAVALNFQGDSLSMPPLLRVSP